MAPPKQASHNAPATNSSRSAPDQGPQRGQNNAPTPSAVLGHSTNSGGSSMSSLLFQAPPTQPAQSTSVQLHPTQQSLLQQPEGAQQDLPAVIAPTQQVTQTRLSDQISLSLLPQFVVQDIGGITTPMNTTTEPPRQRTDTAARPMQVIASELSSQRRTVIIDGNRSIVIPSYSRRDRMELANMTTLSDRERVLLRAGLHYSLFPAEAFRDGDLDLLALLERDNAAVAAQSQSRGGTDHARSVPPTTPAAAAAAHPAPRRERDYRSRSPSLGPN